MKKELTVQDYEKTYDAILAIANDADGFGLFADITEEDVEKCKWIAAILTTLDDIPRQRMEHIFRYRKIKFDYLGFLEE